MINVLRIWELEHIPKEQRPDLKDGVYIFQFITLPIVGGVIAYAYQASGVVLNPILAINIGASAPLILKSFTLAVPAAVGRGKVN